VKPTNVDSGLATDAGGPSESEHIRVVPYAREERMEAERANVVASAGDRVIVHAHHQGEHPRDGEILEVQGEEGGPPYVVRWDDGRVSALYPSSDVLIHHFGDDD